MPSLAIAPLLALPLVGGVKVITIGSRGQNMTVLASQTAGTPAVPHAASRAVLFAGNACVPIPPKSWGGRSDHSGGFVLYARRGGCSFDDKMRTAIAAGAAALLVGDSVEGQYDSPSNMTAASATLANPCIVSCELGHGMVATHSLSVEAVLSGLRGTCPPTNAGKACPTPFCAFSGRGAAAAGSTPGTTALAGTLAPTEREVCCVLDTPSIEMFFIGLNLDLDPDPNLELGPDLNSDSVPVSRRFIHDIEASTESTHKKNERHDCTPRSASQGRHMGWHHYT